MSKGEKTRGGRPMKGGGGPGNTSRSGKKHVDKYADKPRAGDAPEEKPEISSESTDSKPPTESSS